MILLVRLISIIMVLLGMVCAIRPNIAKTAIGFWAVGRRIFLMGAVRILIGVIFISAAQQGGDAGLFYLVGAVSAFTGLIVLMHPGESLDQLTKLQQNPRLLRLIAILFILLGAIIVSFA